MQSQHPQASPELLRGVRWMALTLKQALKSGDEVNLVGLGVQCQ
jgi:hypothetical protein